jgi:hypothetical protein
MAGFEHELMPPAEFLALIGKPARRSRTRSKYKWDQIPGGWKATARSESLETSAREPGFHCEWEA